VIEIASGKNLGKKLVRSYKDTYEAFLPREFLDEPDIFSFSSFKHTLKKHLKIIQRKNELIR